ncbi:hypothetical protein LEP1GSC029_1601 [Leptospira interrogans str. 2002000626]|uniref:Uncharacterized protein n=1 Tax=Leptospira interrogans str. 2002000626 TaxID=996803 RepID=A0A829D1Y3_LEPIR|nr:hypothetical protein LEP1GSC029_1601 [Leptospira interrogans str. 2002000626]
MIFPLKRPLRILKTRSLRLVFYFLFLKSKLRENSVFTPQKQIRFIKNLIFDPKKQILFSEYSLFLKFKIVLLKQIFFILNQFSQNIFKNIFFKYILKSLFEFVIWRNSKDYFKNTNELSFQKNNFSSFYFKFFPKPQKKKIKKPIWFLKRFLFFKCNFFILDNRKY